MTRKFTLVAGSSTPKEALIGLARRLQAEGMEVQALAPYPVSLDWLPVKFVSDTSMLVDVAENLVCALSPEVMLPLQIALSGTLKKVLGPQGLAAQVARSRSMSLSFFQQAGAKVAPYSLVPYGEKIPAHNHLKNDRPGGYVSPNYIEGDIPPFSVLAYDAPPAPTMKVCVWVSGRHVLPLAIHYQEVVGIMAKGGPQDEEGLQLIPITSPRLSRLMEFIRLGCVAFNYSGPLFLELQVGEGTDPLTIVDVSYDYPMGFMTAFLDMLDQNAFTFFYSLYKGNFFTPKILDRPVVSLQVVSAESCEDIHSPCGERGAGEYASYHSWTKDGPTHLPDSVYAECPEAWHKLDGFSLIPATLARLKELGFRVGLKPEESKSEVQQEQLADEVPEQEQTDGGELEITEEVLQCQS